MSQHQTMLRYKIVLVFSVLATINGCSNATDEISKADHATKIILQQYASDNNTQNVYDWIFQYQGEASGHQVFITLAKWSFDNTGKFIYLLENLSEENRESFIRRYTFALTDSSLQEKFQSVFSNGNSSIISEISKSIKLIKK
jgi:hypothetical protein